MNNYVAAAYAVTGLIIGWDYLSPRLMLRRVRRSIKLRIARDAARTPSSSSRV